MRYNELLRHSEQCQLAADEMAFNTLKTTTELNILAPFQSFCDFNLFWLYSIAPGVVVHLDSVEFLMKHSMNFKRKLKMSEFLKYDFVINWDTPKDFDEFKKLIK